MPISVAEPQVALALALDGRSARVPEELRSLVRVARSLAAVPDPEIDPAFAARLEARILTDGIDIAPARLTVVPAVTAVSLVPETMPDLEGLAAQRFASRPGATIERSGSAAVIAFPRRRFVIRRAVASVVAAAMLSALPVVASATALPGSPFYGLKRATERLQLTFARGPVADGFVLVGHANTRFAEADELITLDRTDLVDATLERMNTLLLQGTSLILGNANDGATLRRLARSLRRSNGKLETLLGSAPAGVKLDILRVLASNEALSLEVDEALGISPAASHAATLQGRPVSGAPDLTLPTVESDATLGGPEAMEFDGATPSGPGAGSRKDPSKGEDDMSSSATTAPCFATMYAGPGSQEAGAACGAVKTSADPGDFGIEDGPGTP